MEIAVMDGTIDAGGVRFEACERYHPTGDSLVCECGWLEHDHGELAIARAQRRRGARILAAPTRRAS
jgi:hypothetical protein